MTPSEQLHVAIASENDHVDREVYRRLLELSLSRPVRAFETDMQFGGRMTVRSLANAFLDRAHAQGVRHALVAIDNDGELNSRPEHADTHDRASELSNPKRGCRTCLLESCVAPRWHERGGFLCLAVPVQTIETWLLIARGHVFEGSPESNVHRNTLKRTLYGMRKPPMQQSLAAALHAIAQPDALVRLRERPSFMRFEQQLRAWLDAPLSTVPS